MSGAGPDPRSKPRTHGHVVGGERTRTYRIWQGMCARCYNKNHRSYPDYGGKGLLVYFDWVGPGGFASFLADMGACPGDDYSLDRIDPDRGYEPDNCRWVKHAFNCSRVRRVSHAKDKRTARGPDGKERTLTLRQWAKRLGISYDSLKRRLQRGWGDRAFSIKGRV